MEEIQPLGYTEAKNIEEHKRIIDKINEMLVPVNSIEDDVGTVLASLTAYMNDTIVPAIAQITDALASVQQSVATVQQAVATVSGYNTRLTDVEQYSEGIGDDVAALDTELHTTRPYVDTNREQTITAKKHIPTPTAGDLADIAINKGFVQNTTGLNNLVHTIANELIRGTKTFDANIQQVNQDRVTEVPLQNYYRGILQNDNDGVRALEIYRGHYTNGQTDFYVTLRGQNTAIARLHMVINANGSGSFYIQQPDPSQPNIVLAQWNAYTPQ